MKALSLITGATGFVGRNLAERLIARGDRVRCLARIPLSRPAATALADLGAELIPGDVIDAASLSAAVADADVVYHLAGLTAALRPDQFESVNAEGSRLVAEACARAERPPVLVAVSSLAAAGPSPPNSPRSEEQPPSPVSHYGRSKLRGEVVLHRTADRVPTTIVRPPGVFGPWDLQVLEGFRLVKRGLHLSPGLRPQRVALTSVEDLVTGLIAAAERGRRLVPGEAAVAAYQGYYFVAHDHQPTFAEVGAMMATALGRRPPVVLNLPHAVCWSVGGVTELVGRWRRRPGLFNLDKVREATAGSWTCRTDRAERELGVKPSAALADQLAATARWYVEHGWL